MELDKDLLIYILKDTDKIVNLIKTMFFIIISYYTNYKICNKSIKINKKLIIDSVLIIVITILYITIKSKVNHLTALISLVFMNAFIFSIHKIGNSIVSSIVSISINFVISFLAIIVAFVICLIFRTHNDYINVIVIMAIHAVILLSILKMKRFKYGISFLKRSDYNDVLILNISVTIVFLTITMIASGDIYVMNALPGILLFAIIMYITIQKSLQLYYKQKLLVKDLDETKEELEKKTREVEELEAEILSFSKKSHTLAHKQKSLEYKLQEIMNKTEFSTEEAAEVRERIKEIGKDLYKEKTVIELDKTEIPEIDDMLKYMQSECKNNKIDFELQVKGNIHYMTNNLIAKEDLETLLADHIKNAIIAINHTDNVNRSILVRLGQIDENFGLYIYDSGIEFEPETLKNLGKKPSTTHENEGGTGMGFMNTVDTLRKCKASLIIEEYNEPSKDNYTKALMIKFDNKNEFKIKSYRENTL